VEVTSQQIAPLPCGRDAALIWEQDGLDPHQRDCPHCRAAFEDARGLHAAVARLAARPVPPPPGVVDRVMGAVRAELRPYDTLALPSPLGPAAVGRPAAATVLRRVVDGMAGVRARSCRIEQLSPAPDGVAPLVVSMTVLARFGLDLTAVTARVRQMVIAAGEQALGLPVLRVDIEVVDLLESPTGEDR
jgi:hypothetical protein